MERGELMIEVNPATTEPGRLARWRPAGASAARLPRLLAALES